MKLTLGVTKASARPFARRSRVPRRGGAGAPSSARFASLARGLASAVGAVFGRIKAPAWPAFRIPAPAFMRFARRPGQAAGSSAHSIAATANELKGDRSRLRFIWVSQLFLISVIVLRLFMVQVFDHGRYASLARRQHITSFKVPPSRGAILDRNGRVMAESQSAAAIFMVPRYFFANRAEAHRKLVQLCSQLGLSAREVGREAAKKKFVWLKRPASLAEVESLRKLCQSEKLEGVGWEPLCLRHYPEGALASQLLGFTNVEGRGLEGIEYGYDDYLFKPATPYAGVLRDSRGNRIFTRGKPSEEVSCRASLSLTIDIALQHAVERELEQGLARLRAHWGCALVMDPRTGELLALANAPRCMPNAFTVAPARARMNHVVSSIFEPGSTFKLITISAALQENLVNERDMFNCERGAFVLADEVIHDVEPYGQLSVAEMLAYSSNIGFAKLGLILGADRMYSWARRFGFGEAAGIGVPGEERGLLRKSSDRFSVAAMAFGHGLGVTPIQVAAAYGAVANGGILMKPFVVREVRDARGRVQITNRPEAVRRVVSEAVARRVTRLLNGVVNYGTARAAAIPGYRIAGKTGTAQMSTSEGYLPDGHKIVTFVGFFPADEPKFLVLVTLNRPRWGTAGITAGPVFREIALAVIRQFGLPATDVGALASAGVVTGGISSGSG